MATMIAQSFKDGLTPHCLTEVLSLITSTDQEIVLTLLTAAQPGCQSANSIEGDREFSGMNSPPAAVKPQNGQFPHTSVKCLPTEIISGIKVR